MNDVTNAFKIANFTCSYKRGMDDFLGEQREDFYCIWIKPDSTMIQIQKIGTFFGNKPIMSV